MRIYRCFSDTTPNPGDTVELDENEMQHLSAARRIYPGDRALVLNGRGAEYMTTVLQIHRRSMQLRVDSIARQTPRPTRTIGLAPGLTKGADFDDMFQRSVELGITRFQPLFTIRVAVELDDRKIEKRSERWRRLAIEALKQCERLWLPEIRPPQMLDTFVKESLAENSGLVILHERQTDIPRLSDLIAQNPAANYTFMVGPEGGWSPEETQFFKDSGCQFASLTERSILRAETASIAALSILLPHSET